MDAIKLRARITTLTAELHQCQSDLEVKRREAEKQHKPTYYLDSVNYDKHGYDPISALRIVLKLTDKSKAEHQQLVDTFGFFTLWHSSKHSAGYVYDSGVLGCIGGGNLILQEGPITASEWESIKRGDCFAIAKLAKDSYNIVEHNQ